MQVRRTITLSFSLCVICGALAAILCWPSNRTSEPMFQGRTLSYWLDFLNNPSKDWEHREDAAIAVRHIGTDALPFLLKWMRDETPPWRLKLNTTLGKLPKPIRTIPFVASFIETKPDYSPLAVAGFSILRSEASSAVPELTRVMNRTRYYSRQRRAIQALASIGNEGLEPLLQALVDPKIQDRALIAKEIGWMGCLGTNVVTAIPFLIRCVGDTNLHCRNEAVKALGDLALEPQISIPTLTNCLENSGWSYLRVMVIEAIARFGTNSLVAIPSLVRAQDDSDPFVQTAASIALKKIAPEKSRVVSSLP